MKNEQIKAIHKWPKPQIVHDIQVFRFIYFY